MTLVIPYSQWLPFRLTVGYCTVHFFEMEMPVINFM